MFSIAIASSFRSFGRRSVVCVPCVLHGTARIDVGPDVRLGPGSFVQTIESGHVRLGAFVRCTGTLSLSAASRIELEDHVLLGRNVLIVDHNHARANPAVPIRLQGVEGLAPVLIKRGAWIGDGAKVMPGVTIGRNAVVAAGAVVTRDVADEAVVGGVPARPLEAREVAAGPTSSSATQA